MALPSYLNFNHKLYYWKSNINYRQHPEAYRVGKGEQGVLICEPYKSEILPFWKFKTPELAKESSEKIFSLFIEYIDKKEFIGADMARKYLQMGFTRARRYANYKGGKKYAVSNDYQELEKGTGDISKAKSAQYFYDKWKEAEKHPIYAALKKEWKKSLG